MSSKFNQTLRPQKTPAICKKPPAPIPVPPIWPGDQLYATVYVRYHDPPAAPIYLSALYPIFRQPGTQTWTGQSGTAYPFTRTRMDLDQLANTVDLQLVIWISPTEGDTEAETDLPVNASLPFDTGLREDTAPGPLQAWGTRINV